MHRVNLLSLYRYRLLRNTTLFLIGAALGLFPSLVSARVRSVSNDYFEIAALDFRSLSYMNDLSNYTVKIAERYLDPEGMAYPKPILVSLRPDQYVDFEGDYLIRIESRNSVELDIRWNKALTLESCCLALSEALLTQYALFNHGPEGIAKLSTWPVSALSNVVYLGLRPANISYLVNQARVGIVPELSTVLVGCKADKITAVDTTYGYWFLEAIKSSAFNRRAIRNFFDRAVGGENITQTLEKEIQIKGTNDEVILLETWWRQTLASLVNRQYEVVESMADSRLWLSAIAGFSDLIKFQSEGTTLNLRSIWKYRSEPEVRDLISARREILGLRLARTNPAYYNSALFLAEVYESLLSDEHSHKYLRALTLYLNHWEDVKDMEEIIEDYVSHK
jgi:hypothetical protein